MLAIFPCIPNELRQGLTQTLYSSLVVHLRFYNTQMERFTGFTITLRVLNVQLSDVKKKSCKVFALNYFGVLVEVVVFFLGFVCCVPAHVRFFRYDGFRSWISSVFDASVQILRLHFVREFIKLAVKCVCVCDTLSIKLRINLPKKKYRMSLIH